MASFELYPLLVNDYTEEILTCVDPCGIRRWTSKKVLAQAILLIDGTPEPAVREVWRHVGRKINFRF